MRGNDDKFTLVTTTSAEFHGQVGGGGKLWVALEAFGAAILVIPLAVLVLWMGGATAVMLLQYLF